MILSAAWTTLAVIGGVKTETRRDWSPKTVAQYRGLVESGRRVDLWSKSARFKGKPYGSCRIAGLVENEPSCEIPDEAFAKEGFELLAAIGAEFAKGYKAPDVWRYWKQCDEGTNLQTVVMLEDVDTQSEESFRMWEEAKARYGNLLYDRVTLEQIRARTSDDPEWRGI